MENKKYSHDIPERRLTSNTLQDSETRYRRLFETAQDGILILDAQTGQIDDVNPFLTSMLGYSHKELLGKKLWDIGLFKNIVSSQSSFKKLQTKGYIRYEDLPLETKDGRHINVEFVSNVYLVDHKKVIQCNIRDITERKQAEEKLQNISKFPAENPNPVVRIKSDGVLLYCNNAGAPLTKHWKWEAGKAVSAEWRKLVTDTFKSGARKDVEMTVDNRFFLFTMAPIVAEGYVNVYGRDITERKRAEETLKERERWLSKTQEIAHLGSWELDLVNNRLYWSDEVYRIFGLKPQEFTATYEAFLEHIHPDDRAAVDATYADSLRQGKSSYEIEHRVLRKTTGEIRFVHEKCEHIRDGNNKVIYSIGMVHDLTERKQAEEEVKRSDKKLSAIIEAAPCAILIMDDQLTVKTVNGASKKTFGIPETSVVNHCWCNALRCTHAEETSRWAAGSSDSCTGCQVRTAVMKTLSDKETQRVQTSFEFFVDGEIKKRVLAISAAPIEYEQKKMAVLTVEDITELSYLRERLRVEHSFAGIVGKDEKMQELYGAIKELAESNAPVMIQGESGTGKELVASAIHNEGPRRNNQFVPVNCGALPDGLLESELFGHCKGSFTGAIRDKKGRFALAHGGTIFLDEVGDLSQAMQVKLLRVLQDGSFEPVGSEKTMKVDVRVISATNKDIQKEIKAGRFREDLFYRLCVVPISIPPLRERINDTPLLAKRFLEWSAKEYQKEKVSLSPEVLDILMSYHWTGNVRELQNALQFAMVKCRGNVIKPEHLPASISQTNKTTALRRQRKRKIDSRTLEDALQKTHGNKVEAAKLLGVSRATIHRFLAEK